MGKQYSRGDAPGGEGVPARVLRARAALLGGREGTDREGGLGGRAGSGNLLRRDLHIEVNTSQRFY